MSIPAQKTLSRRAAIVGAAATLARPTQGAAAEDCSQTGVSWKRQLTEFEYKVMREGYNETRGTSPLANETRAGVYACKACCLEVFSSSQKINDGSGWPRFAEPISGRVFTRRNGRFFGIGTNVGCTRCQSHLGIVESGTYRMNGIALIFTQGQGT